MGLCHRRCSCAGVGLRRGARELGPDGPGHRNADALFGRSERALASLMPLGDISARANLAPCRPPPLLVWSSKILLNKDLPQITTVGELHICQQPPELVDTGHVDRDPPVQQLLYPVRSALCQG